MYRIRKAYKEDFEKIEPLFQYFNNDNIKSEQWALLFKPLCKELNSDFYGFILESTADNCVIGFLGAITSMRVINRKKYKICSLSSLVIQPEYRKKNLSFRLIEASTQLDEYHIQVVSPISSTIHLYEKLGFKINQTTHKIILPTLFHRLFCKNVELFLNKSDILIDSLSSDELKIYHEHQFSECHHIILKQNSSYCYLVLKPTYFTARVLLSSGIILLLNTVWKKLFKKNIFGQKIKLGLIHYISNPDLFSNTILKVSHKICKQLNVKGLSVNSCYFKKPSYFVLNNYLSSFGVYKSDTLCSDDFDTLYSELVLFDLEY